MTEDAFSAGIRATQAAARAQPAKPEKSTMQILLDMAGFNKPSTPVQTTGANAEFPSCQAVLAGKVEAQTCRNR